MSKRGNKRYAYNVKKKFQGLYLPFEYEEHIHPETDDSKTSVLFVTLTYDTKLCDFKTAWENIASDWNRYVSRLRRIYGRVVTCRAFEASERGYPHIHAVLFIPDQEFRLHKQHKPDRIVYRIEDSELSKFQNWHSFVDVQGITNLASAFRYLAKYVTKSSDLSEKAITTLACTWAFHKRTFSIGEKFKEEIFKRYLTYDLIPRSITQTKISSQMTLDERELRTTLPTFIKVDFEKYKMLGILDRSELQRVGGLPKHAWSHGLTENQTAYALYRIILLKQPVPPDRPQDEPNREWIKNPWKYQDNLGVIQKMQHNRAMNRYFNGLWLRRIYKHDMRQMHLCPKL